MKNLMSEKIFKFEKNFKIEPRIRLKNYLSGTLLPPNCDHIFTIVNVLSFAQSEAVVPSTAILHNTI